MKPNHDNKTQSKIASWESFTDDLEVVLFAIFCVVTFQFG